MARPRWKMETCAALALALGALAGCGPRLDVGSDLLWTARFEGDNFAEWTGQPGGATNATPSPPNLVEVSNEHAHHGAFAAKLTIDAGSDGVQENAGLLRKGGLPSAAYYSAWYYLPHSATVGTFWVLMKLRTRAVLDDPSTEAELYDLDLINMPSGEMSLMLYDHRISGAVPLAVASPVVPVGVWFQLETFYRNANDPTGQMTVWLDGRQVVDVTGQPMGPTPWVEWDVVSIGENLTPSMEVVYADDCAVSLTRVGPNGIIAR